MSRDSNLLYSLYPGLGRCLLTSPKTKQDTYINRHRSWHNSPLHITFIIIHKQAEMYQPWLHGSRCILWSWPPLVAWDSTSALVWVRKSLLSGVEVQVLPQALQQQSVHSVEKLPVPVTLWELRVSAWRVNTVELYTQPQCMRLKYNHSSNHFTAPMSSSSRPLLGFFIQYYIDSCTSPWPVGSTHSIN